MELSKIPKKRYTVYFHPLIHAELKAQAAREGVSLSALLERLGKHYLIRAAPPTVSGVGSIKPDGIGEGVKRRGQG
jgi:hypothetical protein